MLKQATKDDYRRQILLDEWVAGRTADEAAETLRQKTAELKELNDFLETSADSSDDMLKQALLGTIGTGIGLGAMAALAPIPISMGIGNIAGDAIGRAVANKGDTTLKDLNDIELMNAQRQTAMDIIRRVEERKQKQQRKQIPSARSLF